MAEELPVLFKDDVIIVRRLADMARLDDAFARELAWPEGIKGQIFAADGFIPDGLVLAPRFTGSKELSFHINFSARKEWLAVKQASAAGVSAAPLPAMDKFGSFYLDIKRRIFSQQPWYREDAAADAKVLGSVKEKLGAYRVGYWEKDGAPAGMIGVRGWKDYLQRPVDWISWVGVAEGLAKEERAAVHALMAAWLRDNTGDRVECVVQSFNARSLKFFLKMGFRPVAVHIYKEAH